MFAWYSASSDFFAPASFTLSKVDSVILPSTTVIENSVFQPRVSKFFSTNVYVPSFNSAAVSEVASEEDSTTTSDEAAADDSVSVSVSAPPQAANTKVDASKRVAVDNVFFNSIIYPTLFFFIITARYVIPITSPLYLSTYLSYHLLHL